MIKMGMAAPFDFKLLLPFLTLLFVGLTAACTFGGDNKSPGAVKSNLPAPGG